MNKYWILSILSLFAVLSIFNVAEAEMPCSMPQPGIWIGNPNNSPSAVRCAQQRLNSLTSAELVVDGIFGRLTEKATRTLQASRGLTVDGAIGRQTWAWLLYDPQDVPFACGYPNYPTLQINSRGEAVRCVQYLLNLYQGSGLVLDGIYGTRTRDAVRLFQESVGISVDGVVGQATWSWLVYNG